MVHDSPTTPPSTETRVYTTRKSNLIGLRIIAAFFVIAAAGCLFGLESNQSPLVVSLFFGAGALFFLVLSEVFLARRRLTISAAEVEYRSATSVRRLAIAGIKGFRRGGDGMHPTLLLVPVEVGQKAEIIPLDLGKPGEIEFWARQRFPDLLAIEATVDVEQILADDVYGFSPEERQMFYLRQIRVLKILMGASLAGLLWSFFPRPYEWVIALQFLIVVAALASGALGRGLMTLWGQAGPAHPAAGIAIVLPSFALGIRSFFDFEIGSWSPALAPIGALTLAWMALLLLVFRDARKPVWEMGGALALALLLGGASVVQYNGLFDRGKPIVHKAAVLDKTVVHGKSTTWKVVLQPWGNHTEPVGEEVARDLYEAVELGDTLWVWVQPGALKIPWYVVTLPQPQ